LKDETKERGYARVDPVMMLTAVTLGAMLAPADRARAEQNCTNWVDGSATYYNGVCGLSNTNMENVINLGTTDLVTSSHVDFEPDTGSVNCYWFTSRGFNNFNNNWHQVDSNRHPTSTYAGFTCVGGEDSDVDDSIPVAHSVLAGGYNTSTGNFTCDNVQPVLCYLTTRHRFTRSNASFTYEKEEYTSVADHTANRSTAACWTFPGCTP